MEQPIKRKHCHALLDVPPIYDDVMEIARGQTPPSCRTVILIHNSRLFPDQSPKTLNFPAIPGLEKACSKFPTFSRFPGPV